MEPFHYGAFSLTRLEKESYKQLRKKPCEEFYEEPYNELCNEFYTEHS